MTATLVTALYDIDRQDEEKGDGRKWEEYINWFANTLRIPSPMVVYVDPSSKKFVEEFRADRPTKIITHEIDEIPYFYLYQKVNKILNSKKYKDKIDDPERLECRNPLYPLVIFSKFQWVKRAIEEDHFNTDVFLWMDAGLSRLFYETDLDKPYPSPQGLAAINANPDKAIIQTSMSYYPDLVYADSCGEDYLWDNRSWVMAGLWGGYKEPMLKFAELIHDVFENKMVGNNLVNNEQIAMAYVYKNNPELFLPFENHANMHKDYEFIQELGFVE